MGRSGLTVHSTPAEDAPAILDRHPALGFCEEHDEIDDAEANDDQHAKLEHLIAKQPHLAEDRRQSSHDAAEDDQRDTVADALLGNELAKPREEERARGEGEQNGQGREQVAA